MNIKTAFVIILTLPLLLVFSCKPKGRPTSALKESSQPSLNKDYIAFTISLDTLSSGQYRKSIYKEDSILRLVDSTATPFFHYFRAKRYIQEKQRDSALIEYQKMSTNEDPEDEVNLLKKYSILDLQISHGTTVEATVMNKMISLLQSAEQSKSRITYRFYDLLAKANYQNRNEKESWEYVDRYYKSHPYKSHPVIRQRYYDVSFLLASRIKDYDKMMLYNVKARNLAKKIGDSLAIARTYNNEAQLYAQRMQHGKALTASKIYFDYLKKTNSLNGTAYNNLATSFVFNNQADSAIYYYKKAIAFGQHSPTAKQDPVYYRGLINAYKIKGAYAEALQIADSTYEIEIRHLQEKDAVKVAEIHDKYETEKKDLNIAELNSRNELNEKIIQQQKWTLLFASLVFMGVLSFVYVIQRQRRLKERNELLQSENKRLNIEQKLLQVQLNPHFIFNSIANLQSLVAAGDTKDAVRYLTAFSGLLRNVLEQSRKDFIGLDEEITTLNNYIQLQQMRFPDLFDYKFSLDKDLYPADMLIPPMLLQPFVENAIEHGFRNINYKGLLTISFKVENNQMIIAVDDNGTGLIDKKTHHQNKQSLAVTILKERLEVLFKARGQEAKFEIIDKNKLQGQGVGVHITLPEIVD